MKTAISLHLETQFTVLPTLRYQPPFSLTHAFLNTHLCKTTLSSTYSLKFISPLHSSRPSFITFSRIDGGRVGDDGGGNSSDGNSEDRYRTEAVMALDEVGRSLDSIPKDLAAAIEAGRIPKGIVYRYFELEKSPLLGWLLRFGGFKERLLADDLFLTKVAIECGVGIFTKTAAELERRQENFTKELDLVFADVALDSTSYSLLQRMGAILRNGGKLFVVGTTASLVGTCVTNLLISARKAIDISFASEADDLPILSTSVAYGVYMAVSSNLRYQILAGVIEQRILEPLLHEDKFILSAICFAVRTGNTFLGSLMWVDYARWIGIQKILK